MSLTEWKTIPTFTKYELSSRGEVRNKDGKILNQHNNKGYRLVFLYLHGKRSGLLVHRLVAEAFLENPKGLLEVNHIDRDKTNNEVSNLEWIDRQGNVEHGCSKHYIVTSNLTGEVFNIFNLSAFCREHTLDRSAVNKVLAGKRKAHKGFSFKVLGDDL